MQALPTYLLSGSFAYDTILRHGALFQASILPEAVAKLNVCFDIDSVKNELGGAGGNIAYNASLLSQRPMLVGCLGGDAAQYLDWLCKNGLDATTLSLVPDEGCAHAWITSDASGNQITAFSRGAMVRPVQIPEVTPDLWHLGPEHPANTARLALAAIDQGKSFLFDPGQVLPDFIAGTGSEVLPLDELLREATGIFVNDYEADLLIAATGESLEHWLTEPGQFIVRTRGADGVMLRVMHDSGSVSTYECGVAPAAAIVDPTGCGDAFRAGFLRGYAEDWNIEDCLAMGVVMGSFAIESHGGQNHAPTREAIEQRFMQMQLLCRA